MPGRGRFDLMRRPARGAEPATSDVANGNEVAIERDARSRIDARPDCDMLAWALMYPRTMSSVWVRVAVLTGLVMASGCPGTQDPSGDVIDAAVDAVTDAATDAPVGPVCANPIPTCTTTIRYTGAGASVVLRGDFAGDGWTVGVPMTRTGATWEATVPARDQQVIVYKLVIDGTWQADPGNPRTSPDGFGGANSVVRVDCDHCPARPSIDWRDAILYFVMIDRFANGDTANDRPLGLEAPADYRGGDFVGLRQKIDDGYFDRLGINTLWLTSPLDNADGRGRGSDGHDYSGYHGYWPKDLEQIESRIGTEAELKSAIDAAHRHGLNVIVDYAMNHVDDESPIYNAHRDWFWPNDNGHGGDCVCGGGCNWDDPFDRKRCWFTSYLPDFDFRNSDARRYSVGNAVQWAQRLGADGFRLDAVKHIEDAWLTDLRARLDGEVEWDQVFYLVGETYTGERDLIKYYVNPATMLDGQFDFPLRAQVLSTVLRRTGSMADLGTWLVGNDTFYGPGAVMSTFIGNHDVPRVVSYAEDNALFGDWDDGKSRAWQNQPTLPTSARPFERLAVAYTLLYTSPGVPLIYYGDEVAMPGAGDPDNRRLMQWSNYSVDQQGLRDRLSRLAQIRKAHPALSRGARTVRGASADVLTYSMRAPADDVIVVLNRSDTSQSVPGLPAGSYDDLLTNQTVAAPAMVAPRSALILIAR
jgi:glycosidase